MNLYLATWPDGRVTLTSANSLADLFTSLESIGDVTRCSIQPYREKNFLLTFQPKDLIYEERKPSSVAQHKCEESEETLSSSMVKLINDPTFSDVCIKIDSQIIHCHKAILSARSKYFKAMFASTLKEGTENVIELNGFSYTTILAIIRYIYSSTYDEPDSGEFYMNNHQCTGEMSGENCEKQLSCEGKGAVEFVKLTDYLTYLLALLQASDFYNLPGLSNICDSEMSKCLRVYPMKSDDEQCEKFIDMSSNIFSLCHHAKQAFLQTCIEIYNYAQLQRLNNIQRIIVQCCITLKDSLQTTDIPSSMLKHIREDHLLFYGSPLYFGKDAEFYDFLLNEDLSREHTIEKLKAFYSSENDGPTIYAAHELILRACAHCLLCPEIKETVWQMVEYMVMNGYPIDSLDYRGKTMLHIAAVNKKEDYVERLLSLGANPHVADSGGMTVMDDVKKDLDVTLSYCISQDLTQEDDQSPNYLPIIEQFKDIWVQSRNILNIIMDAMRRTSSSSKTSKREPPDLCIADFQLDFNDDFLEKVADMIKSDATYPSNPVANKSAFIDMQVVIENGGYYALEFVNEAIAALYPSFKTVLDGSSQEDIKDIKQTVKMALTKDILANKFQRGAGNPLCSLKTLDSFGLFANCPPHYWLLSAKRLLSS